MLLKEKIKLANQSIENKGTMTNSELRGLLGLVEDSSGVGCTEYETERLVLKPGDNERDNGPFLKMIREDGDFRDFCGLDFSESRLCAFYDYIGFESYYSIFFKDSPDEMIGYAGIGYQHERYEVEFYISKPYRNKGYCTEALKKILEATKRGEIRWRKRNGQSVFIKEKEIFASVISTNVPAIRVLEKCGFQKTEKGLVLMGTVALNEGSEDKVMADYMVLDYVRSFVDDAYEWYMKFLNKVPHEKPRDDDI